MRGPRGDIPDFGRMWFGSPANDRVGYLYLAK